MLIGEILRCTTRARLAAEARRPRPAVVARRRRRPMRQRVVIAPRCVRGRSAVRIERHVARSRRDRRRAAESSVTTRASRPSISISARSNAVLGTLAPARVVNLVESIDGRGRLLQLCRRCSSRSGAVHGLLAAALALHVGQGAREAAARVGADCRRLPLFAPGTRTGRWIVKSVWEHASLGLDDGAIVRRHEPRAETIERRRAEFGGDWFAEAFVPGRELNVALLAARRGPRALPVAEIRFDAFPADKPRIVGYAAKWDAESFEYRNTPRSFAVEPELAERLRRGSRSIAGRCFGSTATRVSIFASTSAASPWVLEVNANPCLSPDAGFAAALAEAGIGYEAAVAGLIDDALERAPRARRASA